MTEKHPYERSKQIAFSRWGRKCVNCSSKVLLTAHHVLARSEFPKHIDKPWNIIPLCQECHEKLHLKKNDLKFKMMILVLDRILTVEHE